MLRTRGIKQTSGRWVASSPFPFRKSPSSVDPRVAFECFIIIKRRRLTILRLSDQSQHPAHFASISIEQQNVREERDKVLIDTRAHHHFQWIIESSGRHFVDAFLIFPPKRLVCLFS